MDRTATEFYRKLLHETPDPPLSPLCFDIGAHVGLHTAAMLGAGGTVVAVEPNPAVLRDLVDRLCPHRRLTIEPKAVAGDGDARPMRISTRHSQLSTMSDEFVARSGEPQDYWNGWIRGVACMTLEDLADRYGDPWYVKLDIEGFEAQALAGLDHPPPIISFEVHSWLPDQAEACLARLHELCPESYVFNMTEGDDFEWKFERPIGDGDVLAALPSWGDVYCWRVDVWNDQR